MTNPNKPQIIIESADKTAFEYWRAREILNRFLKKNDPHHRREKAGHKGKGWFFQIIYVWEGRKFDPRKTSGLPTSFDDLRLPMYNNSVGESVKVEGEPDYTVRTNFTGRISTNWIISNLERDHPLSVFMNNEKSKSDCGLFMTIYMACTDEVYEKIQAWVTQNLPKKPDPEALKKYLGNIKFTKTRVEYYYPTNPYPTRNEERRYTRHQGLNGPESIPNPEYNK